MQAPKTFTCQRDVVEYIHHALMECECDTNMACAFHYALVDYAFLYDIPCMITTAQAWYAKQ